MCLVVFSRAVKKVRSSFGSGSLARRPLFWSAFSLLFILALLPDWSDPFSVRAATQVHGDLTAGRIVKWMGTFATSISVDSLTATAPNPAGATTPATGVNVSAAISGSASGDAVYTFDCDVSVSGTRPDIRVNANSATDADACDYTASGTYTARVSVSRGGASAQRDLPFTVGQPPTANAGNDRSVFTGSTVALDGSGSHPSGDSDAGSLSYRWTILSPSGISTVFTDVNPTFTAPNFEIALTFGLVVTDSLGRASSQDTVVINVGTPQGTVKLRATVDGARWPTTGTQSLIVNLEHSELGFFSGLSVDVPADYENLPAGRFGFVFVSGGPAGTVLQNITPDEEQTLVDKGIITVTFNFVTLRMNTALTVNPGTVGTAPFAPTLTAAVSQYTGNAGDTMNYSFWWNCANASPVVAEVEADTACGALPNDIAADDGQCVINDRGAKCRGETRETMSAQVSPAYTLGNKFAKVIVERNVFSGQRQAGIAVNVPSQAPIAVTGVSKDSSANRSYAASVDVKSGVATPLFFSGFLGLRTAPSSESSDPDGWENETNGVRFNGYCRFNLDLNRDPPVTFEFGIISPESPTSCEAARADNYTFIDGADNSTNIALLSAPFAYDALQIIDAVGTLSGVGGGRVTVNVHYQPTASLTANGGASASVNSASAVTLAWASTHASSCSGSWQVTGAAALAPSGTATVNPTADTTYSVSCSGSTLWGAAVASAAASINAPTADLKANGSDGPITVAAGSAVTLTWSSANASSCTGANFTTATAANNSTGVVVNPTIATTYTLTCAGTDSRTATDQVQANLSNGPPVAVAGVSKDTNSSRIYTASVDVRFGVATPLFFSAFLGPKAAPTSQSSDPDGWTEIQNGVSSGGKCAFNLDLSRDAPTTYESVISNPASPISCEVSQSSNAPFNDGADNDAQISKPLTYNAVRITDRPGALSNEAPITVNVHYQPTASLTANGGASASVNSASAVTLAWASTHASSCTGSWQVTGAAALAPSGTATVNPTADTTYSVSCSGSTLWGAAVASAAVTMAFNFTVAAGGNISVTQGATTGNTTGITVARTTGSGQSVTLSATGLPAGATVTFSPASCNPGATSCVATMTVATTRGIGATPATTYPVTVVGAAGAVTASAPPFNLIVSSQMSVGLSALPSAAGPASFVLQLQADAPASDYTGSPADPLVYTFWKRCDASGTNIAALSAPSACGTPDFVSASVPDLSVRTTDLIYTLAGTYRAKVVVSRGAAAAENRMTITVNPPFGYALSLQRSRFEILQGGSVSNVNRATITHASGSPTAVSFSAYITNLPALMAQPAILFSPSSCAPPSGASCGSDMAITVPRAMPAGDYAVSVQAGSQNATFTLGVMSQISATLTALPSAVGPAPLSAQLRADTSAYTGSSNDSLNYSFWWNCNNPSDNASTVTAACGNPADAAIGYKINGTMQEGAITPAAHIYAQEGVFFGKVIVERGGARREARIPITVGSPGVAAVCTATPATAVLNQPVTWTAVASQGRVPYSYAWTQNVSCGINPQQCGSVEMRYATAGTKFGTVTVTDADGDTATRLCDNSIRVFQPTLVILPGTAQVRVDGDSLQFVAKYDPDGPDGAAAEQIVTTQAIWSIPLTDQGKATVSAAGLLTTGNAIGTLTVHTSHQDAFNNVIQATADIQVISRVALICDPATQTVRTGEPIFPVRATGGTGSYAWLAQEIDATPRSGSTVGSQTFTTVFSQIGDKTIRVSSGSQNGSCEVTVTNQAVSVNLSAFPTSVTLPAATRLTAVVSGNALGTMNYSFWWDCGADKDADNTTRVEIAEGRCGEIPHNVPSGQCQENGFGAACHGSAELSKARDHIYENAGTKTPKVIVERGNAASAQAKSSVVVDSANIKPDAIAGISFDVNATRVYSRSIVVTQNVPTRIYFAAFTGSRQTPDEISADPNGWTNALNGVYHPASATASGQCAWNADLDRNAQVSFEDVSGTNRNPATEKECVTSFVHNFAEIGTYTYAVLRITDNRGTVSDPAIVTVDVVAPGAPVSLPGISNNPSANRIYRDTVSVKQGETAQLWVSAQRRVGAADQVSSDPDGWRSMSGGVSRGGSCRWNRDLDKGVFPTGVPTYEYVINDPLDPAEDCDTQLTNEAGNAFSRVFMDAPGIYAFEALRIFDNTGLRSNKGMMSVEVLPSDPPLAVASASTDNGNTYHGATVGDPVVVVRGAPTPVVFSAAGSTDPDGWTNPVNGVSVAGRCEWNSDLNQGVVTFENQIPTPGSPAACNVTARTYTFNDRPGIVNLQMLKITDNKGFASVPGGVSVRVTAPDLVVSEGPLPASAAALVERGTATFTGKIKNQGDAATTATFNASFKVDLGNDGSIDLTLAPTPTATGLAVGAEKSVVSGIWSNLPAGTHKVTLCADQPSPAVANEFFTDNNCASQVLTVLPDNRPPVAEAGISLDGTTYGASITVLRGAAVQIWLSAGTDVSGDNVASYDPDGWLDPAKGVSAGGKCDWNIDLASTFAVQNTVNNPASPTICDRNRMDKTFNDPPGAYVYPVLRVTDARGAASSVAGIRVIVVGSASQLNHMGCVADACTVVPGAGANVCSTVGAACTTQGPGPGSQLQPDLLISGIPRLAEGRLERNRTVAFNGRVQNRSGRGVGQSFKNAFLIDLNNNETVDVTLRSVPRILTDRLTRARLAALPLNDLILPLPATVPSLGIDEEVTVTSGEWRTIPEGTHRIMVCADSDNEIVEFNESNNCGSAIVIVTPSGGPGGPLRVQSCGVSTPEARAGQLVDWTATAAGGTGVYSYFWSGDAPLEGASANPVSVAYSITGTKSGSVIVTSGSETSQRACGSVNVQPGILEFRANPRQINAGQMSTLSWNTTGFSSCAITADQPGQSIGGVEVTGSRIIQPPSNTVYTLTCSGGGAADQSVTVVVTSNPTHQECTVGTPGCF